MEVTHFAFCRLLKERESLIIQSRRCVSVLTNSKDQRPSEEANSSSASQEIPRILRKPGVHYRIHKSTPPVPIQARSTVHVPHPTSLISILILSSHLRLGIPSGLFPSGFPTKTQYAPLLSPTHTQGLCLAHFILLHFISRILVGYRPWSSLSRSLLHSPVTSSILVQIIFLRILFSNTLSLCSFLKMTDQVSHPYKTTEHIYLILPSNLTLRIQRFYK
jgi:hypothetical protein